MSDGWVQALEVTVTAPVVSFRNPLYAAEQVGLPCPPPATVGGMLAAAAGGWEHIREDLRFAMAFQARGQGVDLETYHPLATTGKHADPLPRNRAFLADVTLTLWLLEDPEEDLELWQQPLRRPVWPLRLGRSQDLASARARPTQLRPGAGTQGFAVLPAAATRLGTLLRLPTAISRDRARIRWDAYRYHHQGAPDHPIEASGAWADPSTGQAVLPLPPAHPVHAEPGSQAG